MDREAYITDRLGDPCDLSDKSVPNQCVSGCEIFYNEKQRIIGVDTICIRSDNYICVDM